MATYRGNNRGSYNKKERPSWNRFSNDEKDDIAAWINQSFNKHTIEYAEKFGEYLVANRLTSAQLRILFGEVKRIKANLPESSEEINRQTVKDFLLLKPKIAYAAKRSGGIAFETLKKVLDRAHDAVNIAAKDDSTAVIIKRVENFSDFFEAILAYHKAYGGRD